MLLIASELRKILEREVRQLYEEGRDIDVGKYERLLKKYATSWSKLVELYYELESIGFRKDFPYREPSALEEIRESRPARKLPSSEVDEKVFGDKLAGAIYGRCAGCMLGKPVEGWPREEISMRLRRLGKNMVDNYFPPDFFTREELEPRRSLTSGNIRQVERDDDIDYTLLNLHLLESRGREFRTEDVADLWLSMLPYHAVYTAERAAYRNLVLGLKPPKTAEFLNPYREWIGAQIRADAFGYASPGDPELASTLAFRDATLSHVKNGIYGEIMAASMIAWAFAAEDHIEVARVGLSAVPSGSRLGEALRDVMKMWESGYRWDETVETILAKYRYHPVHTINNAAIVFAALLWGDGDLERTIALSVMGGLDTDCNGATAGSIAGALRGLSGIPHDQRRRWLSPLGDRIRSLVAGFDGITISEVVERFHKIAKSAARNDPS